MIKEILLSLTVAAFSGVSSFVGSPKRALDNFSNVYGNYRFHAEALNSGNPNGSYYETPLGNSSSWFSLDDSGSWQYFGVPSLEQPNLKIAFSTADAEPSLGECYWHFDWYFDSASLRNDFKTYIETAGAITWIYDPEYINEEIMTGSDEAGFYTRLEVSYIVSGSADVYFKLNDLTPEIYTLTKNLYNCSINSIPELPNTYQSGAVGQTFVIYGAANSDIAGDYGFTSSSLSVSGASASDLSLNNEIGNSGYFRGCSFSVTLPANSFTITLRAYRPEFSIVSTLNNCTVSPAIQSSYSGMFAEDFTFTAEQGFYFNKNVTQWEFTGGVVAQEPEYIGLAWGTLYESVKIRLVFDAGNATIRVSGVAYTIDSYQQGWKDGDKSGYDRGHADGLIAGDSYGVWNWLKQAARTTGEFFNIPLLPGFSIGALLTALAGLVIIWFFIKGFLFKS